VGGGKGRFQVEAGPPETLAPYEKQIRAVYTYFKQPYGGEGWHLVEKRSALGRTKATVVIQGEKNLSPEGDDAFKVPEYIPLLILRRPPGDSSFASISTSHSASVAYSMKTMTPGFTSPQSMTMEPYIENDLEMCNGGGGGLAGPSLAMCKEIMGGKKVLMKLNFEVEKSQSDDRSLQNSVTVDVTTSIQTSSGKPLTGHAGDVFLSLAMSVRFRKLTHISVTETCIASSVDTQKWFFAAHSEDDMDVNEADALKKITAANIVANNQIPTVNDALGAGDGILDLKNVWKTTYLNTAYTDSHARWNTHAVHTLWDIMAVRIPQLEEQVTASQAAVQCIETYDPTVCPSIDVVQETNVYGTAALHRMRILVAEAGLQGWKRTLELAKGLEEQAMGSPEMAMATQEIWTDGMNEDLDGAAGKGERVHVSFEMALGRLVAGLGEQDYLRTYDGENDLFTNMDNKITKITDTAKTVMQVIDIAAAVTGIMQGIVKNGIESAALAAAKNADDIAETGASAAKVAGEARVAADDIAKSMSSKLDVLAEQKALLLSAYDTLPVANKQFQTLLDSQKLANELKTTAMNQADVLAKTAAEAADAVNAANSLGGDSFRYAAASGALLSQAEEAGELITESVVNTVAERLAALSGDETDPWKRKNLNVLGHYMMLVSTALAEALKKKAMGSRNIISFSGGLSYNYNYQSAHSQQDGMDKSVDMKVGGGMGTDDDLSFGSVGLDLTSKSDLRYELKAEKTHAIGRSKHSSVSFTLADSDAGDMFDVAIFKDPVYGTPVFRTQSGRSSCPHETHTIAREKIGILFQGGFKKKTIRLLANEESKTVMFELGSRSTTGDSYATVLVLENPTTRDLPPFRVKIADRPNMLDAVKIGPISAGTAKRYTLTVSRPVVATGDATLTYSGISLEYWSECEYSLFGLNYGGLVTFDGTDYDGWVRTSTLDIKNSGPVNGVTFGKIDIEVVIEPQTSAAGRLVRSLVGGMRVTDNNNSVLSPAVSGSQRQEGVTETIAAGMSSPQLVWLNIALLSIGLMTIVAMRRSQTYVRRENLIARQRPPVGQGRRPRLAMSMTMLGVALQLAQSGAISVSTPTTIGDEISCDSACYCEHLILVCIAKGLAVVPALPDNNATHTVNLVENSISRVVASDFLPARRSEAVQTLLLSKNPITMIGPNALAHMTRLVTLDLADTALRMLAPDVLWPFPLLEEFDASETFLGVAWLHLDPFANSSNLRSIGLKNAHVQKVTASNFGHLTALRSLDLQNNAIEGFAADAVASMLTYQVEEKKRNRELSMGYNPSICSIDPGTLALDCTCSNLTSLAIVGPAHTTHCDDGHASCDGISPAALPAIGTPRPCEICDPDNVQAVSRLVLQLAASANTAVTVNGAEQVMAPGDTITLATAFAATSTVVIGAIEHRIAADCAAAAYRHLHDAVTFADGVTLTVVGFHTASGRNETHCPARVHPDAGSYSCTSTADAGICLLECPSAPLIQDPVAFNGVFEPTTFGVAQCTDGEWLSPFSVVSPVDRWGGKLPHCEYVYASCADAPPSAVPDTGTPRRCEICSPRNKQRLRAITFRWVTSSADRAVVWFSADHSQNESAEPGSTVTVQSIVVSTASNHQAFSSAVTMYVAGSPQRYTIQASCEDLDPHTGLLAIGDVYGFDNGDLVIVGFETSAGRTQASCAAAVPPEPGAFPSSCSNVSDLDICVLECPLRPDFAEATYSGQFHSTGYGIGTCVDGAWKTPDYMSPEPQLDGYGGPVSFWDAKLPHCEYVYASCAEAPPATGGVPAYVPAPRCEICGPNHALHPEIDRIVSLRFRWDLHSPSSGNTIDVLSAANSGIWAYAPVHLAHGEEATFDVTVGAPFPVPSCDVFHYSGSKVMPATLVFRLVGGGADCGNYPTGYAPTVGADCTNPQGGYASVTGSHLSAGPFASASCGSTSSTSRYGNEEDTQGDMLTVHNVRASTVCTVFDSNGGQQTITIHTSGSKPLALGDRFGGLELVGFTNAFGTSSEFCPHPAIRATNRATGEVADLDTSCWTTLAIGDGLNFNNGDLIITGFTMASGRSESQCPEHRAAFYLDDCAGSADGSLCGLQCPKYVGEYSSFVAAGSYVLTGATSDLNLKQCWDGEWDYAFQGTAAPLGSNGWPIGASAAKMSQSSAGSAGLFSRELDLGNVAGDDGTSFCEFIGVPHAKDHTMSPTPSLSPTPSPPTRAKKSGKKKGPKNAGRSKKKKTRKLLLQDADSVIGSQRTGGSSSTDTSGSTSHYVGVGVGVAFVVVSAVVGLTWRIRRARDGVAMPGSDSEHYVTGVTGNDTVKWQRTKAHATPPQNVGAASTAELTWDATSDARPVMD
jgi:hypothetical protein